jgi:hypothetical protein
MKLQNEIKCLIILLFFPLSLRIPTMQQDRGMAQINAMIRSIPGLIPSEQTTLIVALDHQLGGEIFNQRIGAELLNSMKHIVSAGIFEEADPKTIAEVVHKAYEAELRGAPAEYVEDLALIGFAQSITSQQLEVSAKALSQFVQTDIDPVVYQELLSYGLANSWSAETIAGTSQGLIRGRTLGVDLSKLALSIIIRVDQGLESVPVATMVEEEIAFIQQFRVKDRSEKERRDLIHHSMQDAINRGVPTGIAQELYYEAVEEKWEKDVFQAVFIGMVESHRMGLTPERIAIAMIVRIEQGLGSTSPEQMVQEEIAYVKEIEKDRLSLIQKDRTLDYSKPVPDPKQYQVFVEPKRREPKRPEPKPNIYRQSARTTINIALMNQSIRSFIGVRYIWGGNSRRGTDCSGFTQTVYSEQGIIIPRNSRWQYRVGKSIASQNLQYGDLVFFNKYGYGGISHVGIYLGNAQFAHASCSKGVTISRLNKRYYRVRYAGGRRMV